MKLVGSYCWRWHARWRRAQPPESSVESFLDLILVSSSATTTPTPVTASTAAVATAASVTATAAFTWAGFVHDDVAAHEILAVEGLDNAGRFFIVVDFNEAEPTRLTAVAVLH